MTARNPRDILKDLMDLRKQKRHMDRKEYKRQNQLLWDQAEFTLESNLPDPTAGAVITERPDLAYQDQVFKVADGGRPSPADMAISLRRYAEGKGGAAPDRAACPVTFDRALNYAAECFERVAQQATD